MTDREAFEAWMSSWYARTPKMNPTPQQVWQAATAAERERCANVCDAFAQDKWALYKGRAPYTGKEPGRAADFTQGQSDGAEQCADAIRKGE